MYGCTSLRQIAGIITRTALAYSNLRRLRWWLAYLDLPVMWVLTSTPIVRRPELVVSLGTASTQLAQLPTAAGLPRRPRGRQVLFVAAVLLFGVLILGPVPILAVLAPSAAAGVVVIVWYGLLIFLPMLTYAVPSLVQHCQGHGLRRWMATTTEETGRRPVLFTELAAWPATGGGRRGTGDGFDLVRAIAADVARDDAILVCTARTKTLAGKYRTKTGAAASRRNPRLLRWLL